ncbi:MAG TPA: polymer-forming cytoskeletal protein [Bryobacteraceae bacterium]|nr:polymer-forming cytoskeletal protein [Bryobacteraceae bacterium]HPT27023.1 polymer-forming cytoskeletal protein [Bryobacteraceae bacterium]
MWNRSKREEETQARQMAPEPAREAIPTTTYPARRVEEATTRAAAVIGKTILVKGTVSGKEDLLVDGRLEGDVDLPENRLTVGPGGQIEGKIRAREIVIYGVVQGNLEASERVEIRKNAKVIGDLRACRPVIEDEAYFKGNVETIRVDPPKQAKPAAAAPAPAATLESQSPLIVPPPTESSRG